MTLSQTITKSLGWAMAVFILCGASMAYIWYVDTAQMRPSTDEEVMSVRESAKFSPSWAMEKHGDDCWREKDEPKAELPGSILWTNDHGKTVRTTDPDMVHDAFAEALGYEKAPFRWTALCI